MITSNKTQTISFPTDINQLLHDIDRKLAKIAGNKLDAVRYGANIKANSEDFKLLTFYRNVLYKKAKNDSCFLEYSIDDIIERIKQVLNRN